ncbi:4-hydroxythreonine-4-phosphate dehydrogenase PdxA [Flavilitoribacter nigricans]|uniref:4-hydroxythreonine-4-phosphate dehydrogenase PdxA n=1 Tax=Flavilitoribacter nigricans (strain ATCC 23147 / DSM 23189 / NBRC 102662 / NCIMB 1420 / SS-2) TaxID=1122177 RepID=A0A2D0MY15_FLAN2|nr:4-hydroxythreonine-4-phosphate dehydrogenase PdxA [Flavilitoribacter nigricans]PHN01070.1 4-hydroxythreonine-4-phosphate dehydrogenase PdxA [Flavilitoribacter nigricans DSM 23189 = NBRC 102662]
MEKVKVGISIGDINGVGLEVIIKTLGATQLLNYCTPVIYGSSKVISYHKNIVDDDFHFHSIRAADQAQEGKINIVNCWQENVNITLGKATKEGGEYALRSLDTATKDLKAGLVDALITAPINKEAMKMADFKFTGHTEFLTYMLEGKENLMFMVNESLRIGLVTNHIPLEQVSALLNKDLIIRKLKIMHESLQMDFGIERPTIAVLGLNPHASDNGVIGDDEEKKIRPAIVECKKKGMLISGPFPADGFFGSKQYVKYDAILAMYHDQGLVPFKLLSFGEGINFTAGLGKVRTSPDHGTGYDIAGKNTADPSSFRRALFLAIDVVRNRFNYTDMHANVLVKREQPQEEANAGSLPESS